MSPGEALVRSLDSIIRRLAVRTGLFAWRFVRQGSSRELFWALIRMYIMGNHGPTCRWALGPVREGPAMKYNRRMTIAPFLILTGFCAAQPSIQVQDLFQRERVLLGAAPGPEASQSAPAKGFLSKRLPGSENALLPIKKRP